MPRRRPETVAAAAAPARRRTPSARANAATTNNRLKVGSLTAAGSIQGRKESVTSGGAIDRAWQEEAWGLVSEIGEFGFCAQYVGNCFARVHLVPGLAGPDGRPEPAFDDEGPKEQSALRVAELLGTLHSDIGNQSDFLEAVGFNWLVAGEGYVYGHDDGNGWSYDFLSIDELRPSGTKGKFTRHIGNGKTEEVDSTQDDTLVLRVWRQDKRYRRGAWSTSKPCLPILRELVLLTHEVQSTTLSRLNNGVALIPDSLEAVRMPAAGDPDQPPDDEDEDSLIVDMVHYISKPISDPASAAAAAPFFLRGPREDLDAVRHLLFQRPVTAENVVKRREAIERFANSIDLPPEVPLGHMSTTYANAEVISEDRFKVHIEPGLVALCSALTVGWLWPKLADEAGLAEDANYPEEITQNVVFYDATRLVSHPDRSKEATEGAKMFLLGGSAWRRANGFTESDAPDVEELGRMINILRLANVRETIRITSQEEGVPVESLTGHEIAKALAASGAPGAVVAAVAGDDPRLAVVERFALQLAASTEVAVEAAVTRLGARLRSKAKGEVRGSIDGIPNDEVAATLGPTVVASLAGVDVWAGEFAALARSVHGWASAAGVPDPAGVAARSARLAEQTATRRLYGRLAPTVEEFLAVLTPEPLGPPRP